MLGIKKIDLYILKKFLPLFVGAFFICLFVFMMQFTWRYVEELVGKGLSLDILAQFFWYMGITLVPTALPPAVLLASLITFGNMGEQLELLSMKAAGVPLIRIMRPIFFIVLALTGLSFYFQNTAAPHAQVSLRTLIFSMKQSSPAVEIPEGVFYSDITNINLYVQRKDAKTGMLYQLIIYKTDQGFDRAQIVLADSGRMEMTADKLHLKLDLWCGEQFENLQQQNYSSLSSASVPYDRETFQYKQFIIDFDSNFAMMDENLLRDMPQAKDMRQIQFSVDSMEQHMDSVGHTYYKELAATWYRKPDLNRQDSLQVVRQVNKAAVSFDSLVAGVAPERMQLALQSAKANVRSHQMDLEWKSVITSDGDNFIRRHWVEWHQKITFSLACLFFFFVGAPLGAIIRKGGLGMPAVISVLIFIFYYIINTSGMKMARDGSWNMTFGMWLSSLVLIPFCVFLTYKANKDSVVFNVELYVSFFRNLLGLRTRRHISRKEVIINDPDYAQVLVGLDRLRQECRDYDRDARLITAPNYFRLFFRHTEDHRVEAINQQLESLVEELANSRDAKVLMELNELPIIYVRAHTTPFAKKWVNIAAGILFPVGLILWLRIWRFRLRLLRDLRQIVRSCDRLEQRIGEMLHKSAAPTATAEEKQPQARPRRRYARRILLLVVAVLLAFLLGMYVYDYVRQLSRRGPDRAEPPRTEAQAGAAVPGPPVRTD